MTPTLMHRLITLSPIFLWLGAITLVLALELNRAALQKLLWENRSWRQWMGAGAICLLAFFLVHSAAPRTHRLFFDEDIYEGIALNMAQNNQASMSNDGRWEAGRFHDEQQGFNKQPNAWPFMMSLAYRLFGDSETVGFGTSTLLWVIAVLTVFLLGAMLFESPRAGLFASFIYACIPDNVRWFSTLDCDAPTACWTALAVLSTLFFFRARSGAALLLCISTWAITLQCRFEVLLLGLLVGLMFYLEARAEFKTPRLYGFLLLLLALLSAHFLQLYVMRDDSWGASGPKMSPLHFVHHFKTNTVYYFNGRRFPLLFTLLALTGLAWPGRWKTRTYAAVWFILTWGVFLFFYAGSYDYGAGVRYALLSFAPLALLAGRGVDRLISAGRKWAHESRLQLASAGVMLLVLLGYLPTMRALGEESWPCRADHAAAEAFAALVPEDGIIMTQNPTMFHLFGKNAAQLGLFSRHSNYVDHVLTSKFSGKIYLHWNYWCNTQDAHMRAFCTDIISAYPTELVAERTEKDQRFALYRVLNL